MTRLLAALLALFLVSPAAAEQRGGTPGDFDFWVLSLSWSPSYCRFGENPSPAECDGRHPGFVVHGLWPQYERGYPSFCPSSMPRRLPAAVVDSVDDIMPSQGLIRHEWEKHGFCSGLSANQYFSLLRRAFEKVHIPAPLLKVGEDSMVKPEVIEGAFAAANPGLTPAGMAAVCSDGHFEELRVCFDKSLNFRRCAEVDRGTCRSPRTLVPAAN
ncbi:MAG: ribonuclease T2 [Bauldia sp.]